MKQVFIFVISGLFLILIASCQKKVDDSNYRQYVIIRFDRTYVKSHPQSIGVATINDGAYSYHDDSPELTDANGRELYFKSSVGVINYMISQGWKFEGIITPHILEADVEDSTLLFSKSVSKDELDEIVQKGLIG